jgi:predicted ferric reductase
MPTSVSTTSHAESPSRRILVGAAWLGLYLVVALAPLAIVFVGPRPEGRGFWIETSVALGFIGLSTLGLQFAVTGRFRHVAAPYGIDVLIQFHRQIAQAAGLLILAHPVILFVEDPGRLRLLNLVTAPWPARFGVPSLALLGVIIALAVWRRRLKLSYETWRITHGILAVLIVAFALVHVELIGHYISHPWQRGLWAAMSLGMIALLAYVRVLRPLLMLRRPYRVAEVRPEGGDSTTLVFEPEGHDGMEFSPGQFAWLTLGSSPFALEDHPFSFSSSAMRPHKPALTIKELGDFTSTVVPATRVGERAWLEGPHGAFTIDRYTGPGYVLIAGGVGITPLMSMLHTLADRRDERHHELIYAAKKEDDLMFRERIEVLTERLDLEVVFVLSDPSDEWEGERGRIDAELLRRHVVDDWPGHLYFVCGPAPMMDAVERALVEGAVPLHRIYTERFEFV